MVRTPSPTARSPTCGPAWRSGTKTTPHVIFGLTNEPNAISTVQWFAAAQAAIDAIRAAGATNPIMVPGNGFSQPGTWNRTYYDCAVPRVSNAAGWAMLQDPLDNLVVSVHTYFDSDGGGNGIDIVHPHIIGQRLQPVVDWARARGLKVHLSEFGASSANPKAEAAVANAVAYMDANSDVVIGWAWWAYGPPDWWGGYQFTLCPTNDYTVDDPKMAWLAPHFGAPATPTLTTTHTARRRRTFWPLLTVSVSLVLLTALIGGSGSGARVRSAGLTGLPVRQ